METEKFVTNVGLITSNGPYGHNVMACEWTHQLSYDPFLIAVCIRPHKATFLNIKETKVFGVNIASTDQHWVASIAGNNSGKTVDKIQVLKELGVTFYPAGSIDVLMIKGAAMTAECRLVQLVDIGDHPLLIGQAVSVTDHESKPLLYHQGKYFDLGKRLQKPDSQTLVHFEDVIKKYQRA